MFLHQMLAECDPGGCFRSQITELGFNHDHLGAMLDPTWHPQETWDLFCSLTRVYASLSHL